MHFQLAFAVTLVSIAGSAFAQPTERALAEAAAREKKVILWGSPDVGVFQTMHAEFVKKYPGVTLEMTKVQGAVAIDRLIASRSAGRKDVDFLDTPVGYMPLLLNRGLADAFDWTAVLGTDPDKVLYGGRGLIGWHIDLPISFNTGMAKAGDIRTWDDLLDPRWRGKLLIEKRGLAFAVLALKWGEAKTTAYLKKLMENRPIITVGSTQTIEALAGGQGAVAVGPYGGPVLKAKNEGAPIDLAMVGPVPTMLEVAAQVRDGPNPNATRLWMHYLTTPKAQELLFKGQGLGFVQGSALSPLGEMYRNAGLEVVLESTDAPQMQKLLALVSAVVGQH